MKIYKNLVNAIALTLKEILSNKAHADKAIERLFKQNAQWGSRDRRFVAEGVYEIVRNFRLYSELAETQNNFWFITAVWLVVKHIEIPEWPEFKHVKADYILSQKEKLKSNLAVYESYPDWMWQLGSAELGEDIWEREAVAMNAQADVFLRANTLKTTRRNLSENLAKEKIATEEIAETTNTLRLTKRENVFQSKLFKDGWFEVQDKGSQIISEFLNPKPGEFVIDACAGAGGKSLHLAAIMLNKGKIVCLDVESWKLEHLRKRAKRAGVFNIETRVADPYSTTTESLVSKADKLLLDVPCSGLGVLKRNPDAKWKLSIESIEQTKIKQQQILDDYSKMLKPNGKMVYSTCSILPSENQWQVKKFLARNLNFQLIEEKTLLPSEGADGFYMALLQKLN